MAKSTVRLLLVASSLVVVPGAASGAAFPVANSLSSEQSADAAFDGTNFLVSVQNATPGSTGAKLVSPAGAVLATVSGSFGDPPSIAFDGTNYLLAWGDSGSPSSARGLLVDQQGVAVGTPFLVSQSTSVDGVSGVAFDGTNYLVVWTDERNPLNLDVYGRFVSAAGAPVGNEFKISDATGKDASIAFAAPNYLVAWNDETTVRARFISPAGVLQSEFDVNVSPESSDNPVRVATDGTRYLVLWSDQIGGMASDNWNVLGQLVSPTATLLGGVIPIATAPGAQLFPWAAFDGVNYLVTWSDFQNDLNADFVCDPGEETCVDVHGQLVSASGSEVGMDFVVTAEPGNQGQSPAVFGAGRYLVVWTSGFDTSNADVFGTFLASDGIFEDGFE